MKRRLKSIVFEGWMAIEEVKDCRRRKWVGTCRKDDPYRELSIQRYRDEYHPDEDCRCRVTVEFLN